MRDQLAATAEILKREDKLLHQEGRSVPRSLEVSASHTAGASSSRLDLTDSNPSESLPSLSGKAADGIIALEDSPGLDEELGAMSHAADGFQTHLAAVPHLPLKGDAKALPSAFLNSKKRRQNDRIQCQESRNVEAFADENAIEAIPEK